MGENLFDEVQFFVNGKPIQRGDFGCGSITEPSSTNANSNASIIADLDATIEKYNPMVDEFWNKVRECCQKPIKPLTEETTQRISKAFNDIRKTMEKDFPMVFTKRKARKRYKPKFTL